MATVYETEVQKLYVAYFGRPADPAGLAYWADVLQRDPNGYQNMAKTFSATDEYRVVFAGMDNAKIVAEVYDNLFARPAEKAGVDYWVGEMAAGRVTIDNVVTQVAAGSLNNDRLVFNGKVAVATSFTERVDTAAEKAAYVGTAANKIAIDYLAGVKSFETGATYIQPGQIDEAIARIVGTPTGVDYDGTMVA